MNPELLKKMLDCSQGEIPEFLESIRNLEEQQQSSIKQPSMIESATLEEEHQRVSNPSEQGVVKKFNTL